MAGAKTSGAISWAALLMLTSAAQAEAPVVSWAELAGGRPAECGLFLEGYFRQSDCATQIAMGRLAAQRFATCTPGNAAFDGKVVTIAGYIHPFELEFRGVTSFLLAPRARQDCRHPPPPLPDQLISVEYVEGVDVNTDPVWITGRLSVQKVQTHLAPASYVLVAESVAPALIPDVPLGQ